MIRECEISLGKLLRSAGFSGQPIRVGERILRGGNCQKGPLGLVLDVRLPGQSGPRTAARNWQAPKRRLPIIFITGHGDIPMSVQAMKGGRDRIPDKAVPGAGFT